jgi:hypothetical protein
MNEEEENSESNDHDPTIISHEDPEFKEQKPPNDKIVSFKIVDDKQTNASSENSSIE